MNPAILRVLSARRSLSLFVAVVACLAFWQIFLTWRLLEQDRNLEEQRSREHLAQTADLAVAQLARTLADWELGLREMDKLPPATSFEAKLPPGTTFILMSQGSVAVYPFRPVLFVPEFPVPDTQAAGALDAAEALELRDQQYGRAIAALQPLVNEPATHAEALLRIARIERKTGHPDAALETYKRLMDEKALNASATPYGVLAATARCRILMDLGRREAAASEAGSLRTGLLEGRWPLRRGSFEYEWNELTRMGVAPQQPPQAAVNFSILISELYERWESAARAGADSSGRDTKADSSLLLWHATQDGLGAVVAPQGWLAKNLRLPRDICWKLLSTSGSTGSASGVTRSLAEAQLPGRLEFSNVRRVSAEVRTRHSLWVAGAAVMVLLVLVSGYAVQRGISQELRVGRLQSDFVAAVSHEFRSPLTTLRTLAELLVQNRITDESRRQQSYLFMHKETNRLHRLVEDLLDFGRMESGRKQFRMETHDAFELVRTVVHDFSSEAAASGFQIETQLGVEPATVLADEEAFRRAVRNLLENAIKYSPDCRTVWVNGVVDDHNVSISVRDRGMGIDVNEQREIFQKFVRGTAAKKAGIKGTGIGLSMVREIFRAMGGEVRLESAAGSGSTFTLVLPLANT